jgi:hypothetical protein
MYFMAQGWWTPPAPEDANDGEAELAAPPPDVTDADFIDFSS